MSVTLDIYPSPVDDDDYLAVLKSDTELPTPNIIPGLKTPQMKTIVILDSSGSMGGYVRWTCNSVLPTIFQKLNYDPNHPIELLLFDSKTKHFTHQVKDFPGLTYKAQGGTDLGGVFPILKTIFSKLEPSSSVRILAISDGDVSYQEESCRLASELNEMIQNRLDLQISTTAVRIFTSEHANPDVRALSAFLQFTTSTTIPGLIDITPEKLTKTRGDDDDGLTFGDAADRILESFGQEGLRAYLSYPGQYVEFCRNPKQYNDKHELSIFKAQPWTTDRSFLSLGTKSLSTLFWLSKSKFDPTKLNFTISDQLSITATLHNALPIECYEALIKTRIEYYMMQIKLLRVVATDQSVARLKQIADYFLQFESRMYADLDHLESLSIPTQVTTLKDRFKILLKQTAKTSSRLSLQMKTIANMDATATFNSSQAANFLRQTTGGAASKGLVRRAGNDLDFDAIVRSQVIAMAQNLASLEEKITPEIEATFKQSFVSLATTMDGIRSICSLATTTPQGDEFDINDADDYTSILDGMPALEILSFLNLVGVPVQSTIGDYPDPYRYNINVIFSGHYCSLSDLIAHHDIHDGLQINQLTVPGYKGEFGRIDNVIPIFDHPEIFKFIWKYAPSILNYYSSVGMRRVIANVPGTLQASLSAALLKMFRVISVESTEVNHDTMTNIYLSLKGCSADQFNLPVYLELFNAIHYIDGFSFSKSSKSKKSQSIPPITQPVQTTDDIQSYSSQSLPPLAQITFSLTQLLFPLIQLMICARNGKYHAGLERLMNDNKIDISAKSLKTSFPSILRSIYVNEAWCALRTEYRNKPDSTQIIQTQLNLLLGVDPNWKAPITSAFENDIPFDSKMIPTMDSFIQSKVFKDAAYKLQRLNILLALPFLSKLLSTVAADKHDEYKALMNDIPQVITTNETVELLFRTAEMNALKKSRVVDGYEDQQDYDIEHNYVTDAQQEKIDAFQQERNAIIKQVNTNIETLWPAVFFGIDTSSGQVTTSYKHVQFTKLLVILYNYIYPQSSDRFPLLQPQQPITFSKTFIHSTLPDFTYDDIKYDKNSFIKFLTKCAKKIYEKMYNAAVANKVANRRVFLAQEYSQRLLNTNDMDEFKLLLQHGVKNGQYSFQFDNGFQDALLAPFWKSLVNKDIVVPHRLEKLEIVILGRDGDTHIWNKGRILYQHSLHDAAHFFYENNITRGRWIDICKSYGDRRKWEYRESDLPNRHSHHISKPSYWALGYDTLVDYQKGVDEETYKTYCFIHKDCCGLTPAHKKRQKLSQNRNHAIAGNKNPKA